MNQIQQFLMGKKTYILMGILVLKIVYDFSIGNIDSEQAINFILLALGGSTMRAGITKSGK